MVNKKKILIASFFAVIMLTVPFTVVGNNHINSIKELESEDDTKLEKESKTDYSIPEYIDITGISISREDLENLKEKSEFVAGLNLAVKEYTGEELSVFYIPLIKDGIELLTIPMLDPAYMELSKGSLIPIGEVSTDNDLQCWLMYIILNIAAVSVFLQGLRCAITDRALICWRAFKSTLLYTLLEEKYEELCFSSYSSSGKNIIDANLRGETVEVAEVISMAEKLQKSNDCGCQQNKKTVDLDVSKNDKESESSDMDISLENNDWKDFAFCIFIKVMQICTNGLKIRYAGFAAITRNENLAEFFLQFSAFWGSISSALETAYKDWCKNGSSYTMEDCGCRKNSNIRSTKSIQLIPSVLQKIVINAN